MPFWRKNEICTKGYLMKSKNYLPNSIIFTEDFCKTIK